MAIPGSVKSIGNNAFANCSSLKSVIYNGISEPENSGNVFLNCSKLTSVNVPNDYKGRDGGDTFCGIQVKKPDKPNNSNKPSNASKKAKKAGIIAGAVIGGLVVVGIIAVIVVMFVKKRGFFANDTNSLNELTVVDVTRNVGEDSIKNVPTEDCVNSSICDAFDIFSSSSASA